MTARKSRKLADKVVPRADLAREVGRIIADRGLSQAEAARIVNDAPSEMCVLLAGAVDGFSAERLIRMLALLATNVEIVLRRNPDGRRGAVRVRRATAP